jgi:hypothetical protein
LSNHPAIPKINKPPAREALVLTAILAIGLALRLWALQAAGWALDGDEAVFGIMALDIQHGARPVFMYGQHYMGAIEPYLAAPLFTLFGSSQALLHAPVIFFSLLWIIAAYLLARRLGGRPAAAMAALVTAVPSLYVLIPTLKVWGGTVETLAFGLLIFWLLLLLTAAALTPLQRGILFVALGFIGGLAFWTHWLIGYFLPACLVFVLLEVRRLLRSAAWLVIPGFAAGSLPFWLYNLPQRLITFRTLLGGTTTNAGMAGGDAWFIIKRFLLRFVPPMFAAPNLRTGGVFRPDYLVALVYLAAIAWLVWQSLTWRKQGGQRPAASMSIAMLVFIAGAPTVYALSGFGQASLNAYELDLTGRYVVPLYAIGVIALALFCARLYRRQPLPALLCFALVLGMNLAGLIPADFEREFRSPYYSWQRLPASHQELIQRLEEQGIHSIVANHWVGNRLMFESQLGILSADYYDIQVSQARNRFPIIYRQVLDSPEIAYIIVANDESRTPLEQRLQTLGVKFARWAFPPYLVYLPLSRQVGPEELGEALKFPY